MMLAVQAYVREGFGTRDWHDQTTVTAVGLALLGILVAAVLTAPRRWLLVPFLAMACLVPQQERIVVAGADFAFLRLLLLVGCARIAARREWRGLRVTPLDRAFAAWCVVAALGAVLQVGTKEWVIYRGGLGFDFAAAYLVCRTCVRSWDDLHRAATWLIAFSVPVALAMAFEKLTMRNPFSVMNGVPELAGLRNGRVRAFGPYTHPILAGTFWAVLLPLFAARLRHRAYRERALGALGVACALAVVWASGSSTPVMAVLAAAFGMGLFALRHRMREIRWAGLAGVVALHLYMKQPVWHLLARIDLTGGSTGWHRYKLIQSSIDHFHEWWLCGVESTAHWGYYMFDVTNQFVLEAVNSGLFAMLALVWTFGWAFAHVGDAWRRGGDSPYLALLGWSLGVAVFVHVAIFFAVSISHAQQNVFAFLLVLATVAAARSGTAPVARGAAARVGAAAPAEGVRPQPATAG